MAGRERQGDIQRTRAQGIKMPSLSTPQVSPERLMQFTFGFAPPLMIETAIRCGVFDILDKGAKSLDALCVETGTSPRGLRMVLDALVGLDVLSKDDARHYGLTQEERNLSGHRQADLSRRILSADQRPDAFVLERARGRGQERTVGAAHQSRTGWSKLFTRACLQLGGLRTRTDQNQTLNAVL